ncbi:MAG: TSUP family transporter [Candidatus Aminicenantes bacterium]|nr:TSUP family transporter [Candidatus Aminicenantes bacterium]
MTLLNVAVMVLIGIFTGILTGLTGSSGVMVVVPLMHMVLNYPVHDCIGTSLMVDVIAPAAIAFSYHKHGNISLRSGMWIAAGSVAGAQLGAVFSDRIPELGLVRIFGIYMIILGIVIWKKGINREAIALKFKKVLKFKTPIQKTLTSLFLGFVVGILTGLLGAGGGGFVFIILVFVLNFPLHLAVGTSVLIMAITASSGAAGFALHGNIRPVAGLIIGFSAVLGGTLSAQFACRIKEKILAKAIGLTFILLGGIMMAIRLIRTSKILP